MLPTLVPRSYFIGGRANNLGASTVRAFHCSEAGDAKTFSITMFRQVALSERRHIKKLAGREVGELFPCVFRCEWVQFV